MPSPSDPDPLTWQPLPPLDPYAGRQHDEPTTLDVVAEAQARSWATAIADRAFSMRLDRAAVSYSIGDELNAQRWINAAAAVARLPMPWPELGRPRAEAD